MKKVILTKGLPASGKSTWAKKLQDKNPGMYKRVNKDDLRDMLDNGRWSKSNEKFVLQMRDAIIRVSLEFGQHVIVDDTNLHPKHEEHIKQLVKGVAEVEIQDFTDVSVEECIERDLKRDKSVGEKVIRSMYKQLLHKPNPIEQDDSLPPAVIFDIDGTLAKMVNRGPFEWDKVGDDELVKPVQETLDGLQMYGNNIIICTGRDGSCEEDTKDWLARHMINWDGFFIRPEGNTEKDAVIKRRFLEDIVKSYYVTAVFDDRDSVVEMWRDAGLQCFQVNYGDF